MARYYLDTNICVQAWQRQHPHVLARMRRVDPQTLVIPSLVAAELAAGVMNSGRVESNRNLLTRALALHQVEAWNADAIWLYGEHWARLRKAGTPIGAIDLLIACQALADPGAVLVTNNVREFERVEGLRIQDWTQSGVG